MSTEEKARAMVKKPVRKAVRKKHHKVRFTRVLLVLFALLYLPALWNWLFNGGVETDVLDNGLLELTIPSEGVFIREETAIKAPREGIIIPRVNSAERVPNQFDLAMLIDETSQITLQKIAELEENIIRQVAEGSPRILDESSEFRAQVQSAANKLSILARNRNLQAVKEIRATLERLLYQRNKEVFEGRGDRLYLRNEKDQLDQLKQNLEKNATMIQADFSGLVVWDDIPLDEKYRHDNIEQLTPEDLKIKGRQSAPENNLQTIGVDEAFSVSQDQTFARLVSNDKSWYVCMVDSKKAGQIKTGDSVGLKIEELDNTIPCTVEAMQPIGDQTKVSLVFNRMVEQTVQLRNVKAELVIKSVEGLKIPVRSLANRNSLDNTADIILVRFNRAVIKRVAVIAEQDTFAIIDTVKGSVETDPVNIFDIYVVNPQNIEEGQVID